MSAKRVTLIPMMFALLLAVLPLAGCGATPADSTSAVAATTSFPATPVVSAPVTTPVVRPNALPPIAFEDIAYVELTHPDLEETGADYRRILSPVGDEEDVHTLLTEYAKARVQPNEPTPDYEMCLMIIIHLNDGGAYQIAQMVGRPEGEFAYYSGDVLSDADTAYGPTWNPEIVAPDLVEAAEKTIAKIMDAGQDGALPATMPDDFAFVAGYGTYGKNVLDTFAGAFHKDMVLPPYTTARASLALSPAELEEAYRGLAALDVLEYPSDFVPRPDVFMTPHNEYYLRLRANGIEKEVRWSDWSLSAQTEARALREWFKKVAELVHEKPEYKALPDFRGRYD